MADGLGKYVPWLAQAAGTAEYADCNPTEDSLNECPGSDTKQSVGEAWALENLKYLLITIFPSSTLVRSGST